MRPGLSSLVLKRGSRVDFLCQVLGELVDVQARQLGGDQAMRAKTKSPAFNPRRVDWSFTVMGPSV
jgi:hypothetical protein